MAKLKPLLISLLIGVVNAVVFVIFEWLVNEGTNVIWNDIFNTDTIRWMVIPLAIVLSIAFSGLLRLLKQDRIVAVKTDIFDEVNLKPTTLNAIGIIFIVGLASLLAGASLGPEASLMGLSIGIGVWLAQKSGTMKAAGLYALTSVGALLVAFLGSLIPLAIPLLLLYKKEKKIVFANIIPPIVAGLAAYMSLIIIKGAPEGYGTIPLAPDFLPVDLLTALVLGIAGAIIAKLLKTFIAKFAVTSQRFNKSLHWIGAAALFGGVIGIAYFVGGETTQFSGSEGTKLLAASYHTMNPLMLLIIVLAKLLATSWSLPSGYRGGLIFPSIFMGVAMGILAGMIVPAAAGPGVVLGSVSGIVAAMTTPVLGFILILSIAPWQLLFVALAGMVGAIIGQKLIAGVK